MEKYYASQVFKKLLNEFPEDFTVIHDTGRDHSVYKISNKFRPVSVFIDVSSSSSAPKVIVPSGSNGLHYVSDEDCKEFAKFAVLAIEKQKIQELVNKDNDNITNLLSYYANKMGD